MSQPSSRSNPAPPHARKPTLHSTFLALSCVRFFAFPEPAAAATCDGPHKHLLAALFCSADEEALTWKPALALGPGKPPLLATRFCPDQRFGAGRFLLGSLEGELALAEAALSLQEKKVRRRGRLGGCRSDIAK